MEPILKNASPDLPRQDYPRPQWKRESWTNLNGSWEFAFDFTDSGEERGMLDRGEYPLIITVIRREIPRFQP